MTDVSSALATDVRQVFSNAFAFAALRDGGWLSRGAAEYGGDSSLVADDLGSDVISVASTTGAFAALKSDGTVVTGPLSLRR